MAYVIIKLAERILIYSFGRKQKGEGENISESFCCFVDRVDRARGGLEIYYVGAFHGLLLVLERIGRNFLDRGKLNKKGFQIGHGLLVFLTVSWLWLFFKLDSVESLVAYTKGMLFGWHNWMALNIDVCVFVLVYIIPIAVYHAIYKLPFVNDKRRKKCKLIFYLLMILGLIFNRGTSDAFIYFQF